MTTRGVERSSPKEEDLGIGCTKGQPAMGCMKDQREESYAKDQP